MSKYTRARARASTIKKQSSGSSLITAQRCLSIIEAHNNRATRELISPRTCISDIERYREKLQFDTTFGILIGEELGRAIKLRIAPV